MVAEVGAAPLDFNDRVVSEFSLFARRPTHPWIMEALRFRPRRPRVLTLLFLLMAATLAVAVALVAEAWRTTRAQQETTEEAIQGYASYAAWNTARFADVGMMNALAVTFRYVLRDTVARGGALAPLDRILGGRRYAEACDCVLVLPVDYYFRLDLRSMALTAVTSDGASVARADPWLVAEVVRRASRNSGDFTAFMLARPEGRRFVSYAPVSDRTGQSVGVYGLVSGASAVASALMGWVLQHSPVLPTGVTAGLTGDSLLAVTVFSPGGATLVETTRRTQTLASDTASMAHSYGGMRMMVGLRPAVATLLPLSQVPRTRMAILVGLLVLGVGSVVLTALLLRQQHELARLRSEFTASVSHELRTPLAQILLYGEMLIFERTRSRQKRRVAAEVIVREARRLMHMVENALHFTRADHGVASLAPAPMPVAPVVRDTLVAFAPIAWAAEVTIQDDLDPDAWAVIDRAAIRQIVLNILDNAVKYGPRKQLVLVTLRDAGEVIRLAIEDQGPGIAESHRDAIWLPFVRGNGRASNGAADTTGSGIGLAVVRDLVTRLGGRIWVESAESGRGARFVVELTGGMRDEGCRMREVGKLSAQPATLDAPSAVSHPASRIPHPAE